ncbi:pirin family protein [Hymenobacter rubidus]|uniref:pirin family protein n=1 Tax=Hymenobacter rubidus TaxID=1441626 RepID=UPI00191DD403|nr:hypothetical protein [Hymenobacter rubidus]
MPQQTPGKIFLAEERGLAESDRFRRFSTFNFGPFAHAHKGPFGRLYGLNEETLAGGHALDFTVAEASHVLILPLTGAVTLNCVGPPATTVDAGQLLILTLPAASVLHVKNPFATELVGFLHIWLLADSPVSAVAARRAVFSLDDSPNQLIPLAPVPAPPAARPLPLAVSVGRFAGRHEAIYQPSGSDSRLFVFVLAGAFEVEGRLMHANDGLALWDAANVELEALSNDAVLMVLEIEAF